MVQELQELIERYLSEAKHRTLNVLSSKSGVSYSTIRRIAQGEVRETDLTNALAILQVVTDQPTTLQFLKKHFPEAGNYFESVSKRAGVTEATSVDLQRLLLDYESFVIVALASTVNGCTAKQVTSVLGNSAQSKLTYMLDNDLLTENDGAIKTKSENLTLFDNQVVSSQIAACLRFIRDEHIGKQRQHCAVRTYGVTEAGQKKAHALIQRTLAELDEILTSNAGPIPIFASATMGTFFTEADNA